MPTVFANGRSIVHAGDGQVDIAAPPDVCKTPSPVGPVPIPYVNIAKSGDLADGTKSVTIEGNSVAVESSNLSTSTGDEPGTAGGIISSKNKGKLTWKTSSLDVKFEGKGVVRFGEVTLHNGNSFNTAFIQNGGTGFAYGDDFQNSCPICGESPDKHAVKEKVEGSLRVAMDILGELNKREEALRSLEDKIKSMADKLESDRKTILGMKQTTIERRQGEIDKIETEADPLRSHRREASNGYMIGVMVCISGDKFAAISGGDTPEGFVEVAKKYGVPEGNIIKENAEFGDIANRTGRASTAEDQDKMRSRWDEAMSKHREGTDGYNNRPGTCAGAKLIAKSGHVADSMTELFFPFQVKNRRKGLVFEVIFRGPETLAPTPGEFWSPPTESNLATDSSNAVEETREMKRRTGETVPSCRSCQETLFMALCDKDQQTCKQ